MTTSSSSAGKTDLFAEIATGLSISAQKGLREPNDSGCPSETLPLQSCNSDEAYSRPRSRKIETAEQLQVALAGLRDQMAPFLQDLAPSLPLHRPRLELKRFQWRVETPEDLSNFTATLAGNGTWEDLQIPHYGPPLGRAFTLYRTTFDLPPELQACERTILRFDGVDYSCKVYLNGICLGTHEGFFEPFEFDATPIVRPRENILLIRVENDHTMLGEAFSNIQVDGDKIYAATGIGYDDPEEGWHHCPPGMGIWQGVHLEGRAHMAITDTYVRPLPNLDAVEVHVEIDKAPFGPVEEEAELLVSVFGQNFPATVHDRFVYRGEGVQQRGFGDLDHGVHGTAPSLMGAGRNFLSFTLPMDDARIWDLETPWLYQIQICLLNKAGNPLDAVASQFGMRTFTQDETSDPKGRFFLNGREIRLRGANTMGNMEQCVFRGNFDQLRDDILLAKLTRLNFLRLTQHPVQQEIYEYCDRLGLLLQTDLPLFATIRRNQFHECVRQAAAMERLVRSHPCSAIVSFINEPFPASRGKPHRFMDREDMELFFDMASKTVLRENPDRVVKCVDGDYDPPARIGMSDNHCYCGWYIGHGIDLGRLHHGGWLPVKPDWHYGCGEFGSEGLDSYGVMQEFYPESWLPESSDASWNPGVIPKAQTMNFHRLWYPTPRTVGGWIHASQKHQEWITRLMTEAFRRKVGMNTFAIHLFIDAWPAGWMKTIMDVHRVPKRAWFTYRDALAPLAVSLRSDRTAGFSGENIPVELWICNDLASIPEGCRVNYDFFMDGQCLAHGSIGAHMECCAPVAQGTLDVALPQVTKRSRLHIGATLLDAHGEALHDSEITLEVFPIMKSEPRKVHVIGDAGAAQNMLASMGSEITSAPLEHADAILITDHASYVSVAGEVSHAVQRGAVALFFPLPPGQYPIGSEIMDVRKAGMGPRHFVSCSTGHPLVSGFAPEDFKFWFDEGLGYASPILQTTLAAESPWQSILETGDGGWDKNWGAVPAAAEYRDGQGFWRVCQVDLSPRLQTNPAARIFADRLLHGGHSEFQTNRQANTEDHACSISSR